jgi:hypothetical protein
MLLNQALPKVKGVAVQQLTVSSDVLRALMDGFPCKQQ